MDILSDKKLVISSLLSVAIVFAVFLTAGYINLPFYTAPETTGPGSCLILEEQYCKLARFYAIDANGTKAAALNVPDGTSIYMPFDGAYFDESPGAENAKRDKNTRMRLGIIDTSMFMIVVADHSPSLEYGANATIGEKLAAINAPPGGAEDFNLIVYGEGMDLDSLFE